MKIVRCLTALVLLAGPVVANAALISVDGGLMVNDTALNVTWANTVGANLLWNPAGGPGTVQAWLATLNAENWGGYTDWTLPTGDGSYGPFLLSSGAANQLGYLLDAELGNFCCTHSTLNASGAVFNVGMPQIGDISLNTALNNYDFLWSGTPYPGEPGLVWVYSSKASDQNSNTNLSISTADIGDVLAVRFGQVSAVPLPASAWLMLSGLAGLAALSQRGEPHRALAGLLALLAHLVITA